MSFWLTWPVLFLTFSLNWPVVLCELLVEQVAHLLVQLLAPSLDGGNLHLHDLGEHGAYGLSMDRQHELLYAHYGTQHTGKVTFCLSTYCTYLNIHYRCKEDGKKVKCHREREKSEIRMTKMQTKRKNIVKRVCTRQINGSLRRGNKYNFQKEKGRNCFFI